MTHEEKYEWDAEKKELKKIEQKSTWSEEDERMFTLCASSVQTRYNDGLLSYNEYEQASFWLKSLKERHTWKPSAEQMHAIRDSIEFLGCTKKVREDLKSLYEDLKKLKGATE